MDIDFSKIDSVRVGYHLSTERRGEYIGAGAFHSLIPITFRELIEPSYINKSSRWQVYWSLREELGNINNASNQISVSKSRVDLEDIARLSLRKDAIANAMNLMVIEYLSKGNIDNSPHYSNL